MKTTETKSECIIHTPTKPVAGIIHLIEVDYAPGIVFWNAVLQSPDDLAPVVSVTLPDGRRGMLRMTSLVADADGYRQLVAVGMRNT